MRTASTCLLLLLLLLPGCDALDDAISIAKQPPAAPTGLNASVHETGGVQLAWEDNADNEDAYIIEWRLSGGEFEELDRIGKDRTDYLFANPPEQALLYFRVIASNAHGESGYSNTANITIALHVPTGLIADRLQASRIDLSWIDRSDVEEGYAIQRKTTGSYSEVGRTDADATSWSDTTVSGESSYTYRVAAFAGAVFSPWSVESHVQSNDPLEAPSSLTATREGTSVHLTWDDESSREDGFIIEKRLDTTSWAELDRVDRDVTSYVDSGVDSSVTPRYRVAAFNADQVSVWSNVVIATLDPTLQAPVLITAEAINESVAIIVWVGSGDQSVINVVDAEGGIREFLRSGPSGETEVSGLTPLVRYSVSVRARSGDQTSPPSNEIALELPLIPPTDLVWEGYGSTSELIRIEWADNSSVEDGYRVVADCGAFGVLTHDFAPNTTGVGNSASNWFGSAQSATITVRAFVIYNNMRLYSESSEEVEVVLSHPNDSGDSFESDQIGFPPSSARGWSTEWSTDPTTAPVVTDAIAYNGNQSVSFAGGDGVASLSRSLTSPQEGALVTEIWIYRTESTGEFSIRLHSADGEGPDDNPVAIVFHMDNRITLQTLHHGQIELRDSPFDQWFSVQWIYIPFFNGIQGYMVAVNGELTGDLVREDLPHLSHIEFVGVADQQSHSRPSVYIDLYESRIETDFPGVSR